MPVNEDVEARGFGRARLQSRVKCSSPYSRTCLQWRDSGVVTA